MGKLAELMKWGFSENTKREKLLERPSFVDAVGGEDSEDYKALVKSESVSDGAYLIQEEVYNQVIEGSEPKVCMREVFPIINTDSYSVRVVSGEAGTYAEEIAEGATIPIDTQEYSKTDISVKKIGVRPLITNELIEDELFDIAELEVKKAGKRCENKLNQDVLTAVLEGATTSDTDPGTNNEFHPSDIAKASRAVKTGDYDPDTLILSDYAEGLLMGSTNLLYANRGGTDSYLKTGQLPNQILGLKPYLTSVTSGNSSDYWDTTDGANHYMGAVLDTTTPIGFLAMRRDLTVERYDDPIHDLIGIAVTMRYGEGVVNGAAGNLILTT